MTAAQPNKLGPLAGTFTGRRRAEAAGGTPTAAGVRRGPAGRPGRRRTYRPGDDQPDEGTS